MSAEVKKEVVASERVASPPAAVATSESAAEPGRHLPPFSSFAADGSSMDTSTALGSLQAHEFSIGAGFNVAPWEYYEGLTGRLIDARGEVVLASHLSRPWESKSAMLAAAAAAEGLPSFASQFSGPTEPGSTNVGTGQPNEPQLTTLTPLSPASMSHSPPVSLPSFHTLGAALPAPQPQRAGPLGYPLVPAPVQARELPSLQQQLVDERHIQLLGASPVSQGFAPPMQPTGPPPPQVQPSPHQPPPHHTMLIKQEYPPLTVVKQEYPQLHHANFQNPMSTVLDCPSPTSRPGGDGRKKERRKARAGSLDSEEGPGAAENSGQVAAVSSTGSRNVHHMGAGLNDGESDGALGDKPAKKKRKRCGECIGCQRKDNCGDCAPCRNDKSHQICKMRRCEKLTEKKVSSYYYYYIYV